MSDQATALRGLIEQRQESLADQNEPAEHQARTIAVTSGKGGVGKSCLSLNLAVALAQSGSRVCLLDACLGLGNIDLLCGLNAYWNLSHFITGARALDEIVLQGPAGISVIPGASGLTQLADLPADAQRRLMGQMTELERSHDILIIDTSSGIHRMVRSFAATADQVLVVTMPEPTAIADAYATVKALTRPESAPLDLVVNQVKSASEGQAVADRIQQTARLFPKANVRFAGSIRQDAAVCRSVIRQHPCVLESPDSCAASDFRRLAGRISGDGATAASRASFFDRLRTTRAEKAA